MTERRRPKWPLGLLVVALVTALAGAGVVYAHWTKTLDLHADVETGNVTAEWDGVICTEFFDWPWPPEGIGEVEGKEVADVTVDFTTDPMTLLITVDNAYPSYAVDCEIEWRNLGSIPVIIRGWRLLDDPQQPSNLENCTETNLGQGQNITLECDELTVEFVDGVGSQIDPGVIAASSLRFHVEQDDGPDTPDGGNQNTTLRFWMQVCMSNWNEPQTGADCFTVDDLANL